MAEATAQNTLALDPAEDAFLLGGWLREPEPEGSYWKGAPDSSASIVELWREYQQLSWWIEGLSADFSEEADSAVIHWGKRQIQLEREIIGRVAIDRADLIAQARLLRERNRYSEWDHIDDALIGNIIAGIENLGRASTVNS